MSNTTISPNGTILTTALLLSSQLQPLHWFQRHCQAVLLNLEQASPPSLLSLLPPAPAQFPSAPDPALLWLNPAASLLITQARFLSAPDPVPLLLTPAALHLITQARFLSVLDPAPHLPTQAPPSKVPYLAPARFTPALARVQASIPPARSAPV